NRRLILAGTEAAGSDGLFSTISNVHAQSPSMFSMTLTWIVNWSNFWSVVGRSRGYFKSRGIDLEVSRGFGSPAATQSVANGKFDFGFVFTPGIVVNAARGLFTTAVATVGYDSLMGVAVPENSPIRKPTDLEGRTVGMVLTSAEAPFFNAWLDRNKVDGKKITRQTLDSQLIERALINKQVDAITCIGTSSLPLFQSLGFDTRFMGWAQTGLDFYSGQLICRPEMVEKDAPLVQAMVDAFIESVVFTLRNPEEAIDIIVREQPEIAAVKNGRENFALAQALAHHTMVADEAIKGGLGVADLKKVQGMVDATLKFAVSDGKPFTAEQVVTNRFAGRTKLSGAEWEAIRRNTEKVRKLLTT
ncbi:MAG: ABC transporter substrate-binding protein, partial [bacterium]